MNVLHSVVFALLLPLAAQNPPAKPVTPDTPAKKPETPAKKPATTLQEQMQGAWQLTDMETNALRVEGRVQVGFMLVGGDYLSLELHVGWAPSTTSAVTANTFVSGMHRFTVDQDGRLSLSTVIGATTGPDGLVVYDPPGSGRTYKVEIDGTRMTLTREADLTRFVFTHLASKEPDLDFYGRPKKPKDAK